MRKLTVGKRRLISGLVALAVLACACGIVLLMAIDGPIFLGEWYGPDYEFSEFIKEHSGLPRENVDFLDVPDSVNVYPVVHWTVGKVEVESTRGWLADIFDDDPAYCIPAEVHVQYADGYEGTLTWRSWRYGQVYGPLVLCKGDGPPGVIELLDLRIN